jgi:hypothetical protein
MCLTVRLAKIDFKKCAEGKKIKNRAGQRVGLIAVRL